MSGDRGDAALTTVILAPAMIMLILFAVLAGRLGVAKGDVEQAARDAARAVSLQPNSDEAAETVAMASVESAGVVCADVEVHAVRSLLGDLPQVEVTVRCHIALTDLTFLPGVPGSKTVEATAIEVIDQFRSAS